MPAAAYDGVRAPGTVPAGRTGRREEDQTAMAQPQTGLTQDEIRTFATKLAQFREGLNPKEQRLFVQLLQQAKEATGGEVRGYESGDNPQADWQQFNEHFPWTNV